MRAEEIRLIKMDQCWFYIINEESVIYDGQVIYPNRFGMKKPILIEKNKELIIRKGGEIARVILQ